MSYTNNIRMDAICNYLNLETKNASHMSLPCINKGKERDVAIHDLRLSQSNLVPRMPEKKEVEKTEQVMDVVEGFSSDMGSLGVTYAPSEDEKDTNYNEGTLDKICRSSFSCDLTGVRPMYQKPYDICGDKEFIGIDINGKVICKGKPKENVTYGADAEMKTSSNLDDMISD